MGKSQSCGIETLWSMHEFTRWKQHCGGIIYVPRIKHPLRNEQFSPLKIRARAEDIERKSNTVVKNWENTSAIYWHENIQVEKQPGSSAYNQTRTEEAVWFNHI